LQSRRLGFVRIAPGMRACGLFWGLQVPFSLEGLPMADVLVLLGTVVCLAALLGLLKAVERL
jgi:hypothetical protein